MVKDGKDKHGLQLPLEKLRIKFSTCVTVTQLQTFDQLKPPGTQVYSGKASGKREDSNL